MGLSAKAMAWTGALLWGGCLLVVGLIHMIDASYGGEFLRMMSSVYPGADSTPTLGRVLLGALYGFIDGGAAGWLFAALYHFFAGDHGMHSHGPAHIS